jgi:hypothetical protein
MKRLTENEYKAIKRGLKLSHSRQDVARDVNRSVWTVGTVDKSNSYEDYCLIINKKHVSRTRKQAPKQTIISRLLKFIKRK